MKGVQHEIRPDVRVSRRAAENVAALDPVERLPPECLQRNPEADVRQGVWEELSWEDDACDAALSCLVIAFIRRGEDGVDNPFSIGARLRSTRALLMVE